MNPDTPSAVATKKPRTAVIVAAIAGGAIVIAAIAVALILNSGGRPAPTPAAGGETPASSGVSRPDKTCVTTDGTDHKEYWDGNGWWAGRVDGEIKEMPANSVLLLKLGGHQINSVWICAPRSNG